MVREAVKANDDYLSGRVDHFREPSKHGGKRLSPDEWMQHQLDENFRAMEQIRARVDNIVKDPKTAAALKPYYPYACKRPTFHDQYLPTFNQPHVHLVDTAPKGVQCINENGVIHDGVEYPVDVLIYATGFQWMATSTFDMIYGEEGKSLTEKWQEGGTKTWLGLHSKGFPNLFVMTGPQGGGGSFNFTDTIDDHSDYILWVLKTMQEKSADVVDVKQEVTEAYAQHCAEVDIASAPLRDCVAYYDHEGAAEPGSLVYYGGGRWHKHRVAGQESLEPYEFRSASGN